MYRTVAVTVVVIVAAMSEAEGAKRKWTSQEWSDWQRETKVCAEQRQVNRRYYQKWLKQIADKERKGLLSSEDIAANDCYMLH